MTGIICALKVEVEDIIKMMENVKVEEKAGMRFYSGKIFGKEVAAVECGVGKVNAAMCAQVMIDLYSPNEIINSGIAGALSEDTEIGDVVICTDVVQHDMDTTELGEPRGQLQFNDCVLIEIEANEGIVKRLESACSAVIGTKYKKGRVATGDRLVLNRDKRKKINEIFSAVACEMEGGAIAQVCFRNKVPFGIIRAISDSMRENEGVDYFKFRDMAASRSVQIICEYLRG